jgi:hypothetical protein
MHDWEALRRFNKTAEKWRDLAEKRRLYFVVREERFWPSGLGEAWCRPGAPEH